jgi:hypothetical protein
MVMIVFLLGRPGSGKSSVAQLIQMFAKDNGWISDHIYDYKLLQEMFSKEEAEGTAPEDRKFNPKGPKDCHGFDVINFSVLDTVLEMMADKVWKEKQTSSAEEKKMYLVEFARANYSRALQRFGGDLLEDALLLYLNANVGTCIDRIHQRVDCQPNSFNHFVSDEIMNGYYREDDWPWVSVNLQQNCGLSVNTFEVKNTGSFQDLTQVVKQLVDTKTTRELVNV